MLLVESEQAAQSLLSVLPVVPSIEGEYGGQAIALEDPDVEGGDAPRRCAWGFEPSEAQQDYIEAQAQALGLTVRFLPGLPGNWVAKEEVSA